MLHKSPNTSITILLALLVIVSFSLALVPQLLPREVKLSEQRKISTISESLPQKNLFAIQEYQQSQTVRALATPSTYQFLSNIYVTENGHRWICTFGAGTAFTIDARGYFATNNHLVETPTKIDFCLKGLAKKRNVDVLTLKGLTFDTEYLLTDVNKKSFAVTVVKAFPAIDLAILTPNARVQKWIPVEFRTKTPSIIDGKVVPTKGPMILPDEPVATLGMPLGLPYTLINGYLGNNMFRTGGGIPLIHFLAAINGGSSGGVLYSMLDFKAIGMTTMAKAEGGERTLHSGAVPFWLIQEAFKSIDLK